MPQELVYTSAPHGLAPGTSGFCTVARSVGMSPLLVAYLESRSGYRHVFPPQSEQAEWNPVIWSHCVARFAQSQTAYHVLSRIADAGLDYTRRSNLIAHHLVLENSELAPCGPAALLAAPEMMVSHWNVPPHEIKTTRTLPNPPTGSLKCTHWEHQTGDAGWGGVLAESVIRSLSVFLIFKPGTELLPLFCESLALLPESVRWKVSFSTFLQDFSTASIFRWKGVLAGSPESKQVRDAKDTLILDLTNLPQTVPNAQTSFVKIARTGVEAPPIVGQTRQSTAPPPVRQDQFSDSQSSAPPRLGEVEVPAVRGGTYGLAESDLHELTQKRKRPKFGVWNNQYTSRSVAEEKERKAQRLFFTIIGFTSLIILALLMLLGDELFNSGGMRKGVLNSFSAIFQRSGQMQDLADAGKQKPEEKPTPPQSDANTKPPSPPAPNAKTNTEGFDISELDKDDPASEQLENSLTDETDAQEQQRIEEEEREKREQEEALEEQRRIEKEKAIQKQREGMRQAFQTIPLVLPLEEPKKIPIDIIKVPSQANYPQFAPFFAHKDYVKLEWIAIVAPENWTYKLDQKPPIHLDDPNIQWNLMASSTSKGSDPGEGGAESRTRPRPIRLASVFLSEEGLSVEWNPSTAGLAGNFIHVNKLPFSFLRFTFGPNATTAKNIDAAKPGSLTPEELEKPPPIPKKFMRTQDVTKIDFLTEAWYKDISLWEPTRTTAYIPEKNILGRMAKPEVELDNTFGTDRYRYHLNSFDISSLLILEVSVKPNETQDATIQWNATGVPWRKTISFLTEVEITKKPDIIPLTPVEILLTVEATPEKIKIHDTSQDRVSGWSDTRRDLRSAKKENEKKIQELVNTIKIQALKDEITEINRKLQPFELLPVARNKMFEEKLSIHYSVYLEGKNGSDNLLLLQTE